MKFLFFLSLIPILTFASVLKRPQYVPDENHLAPKMDFSPRQAQEEKPQESREEWNRDKKQRKNEAKLEMRKHKE